VGADPRLPAITAKAKVQELAAAKRRVANDGRPSGPIQTETHHDVRLGTRGGPSTSRNAQQQTSSTEPASKKRRVQDDPNAPLPRDKSLGEYIEFDLSKLHNSKGGFLVDDDNSPEGRAKTLEDIRRERQRERERMQAMQEPGERSSLNASLP